MPTGGAGASLDEGRLHSAATDGTLSVATPCHTIAPRRIGCPGRAAALHYYDGGAWSWSPAHHCPRCHHMPQPRAWRHLGRQGQCASVRLATRGPRGPVPTGRRSQATGQHLQEPPLPFATARTQPRAKTPPADSPTRTAHDALYSCGAACGHGRPARGPRGV
jgi:hypothetical protein